MQIILTNNKTKEIRSLDNIKSIETSMGKFIIKNTKNEVVMNFVGTDYSFIIEHKKK